MRLAWKKLLERSMQVGYRRAVFKTFLLPNGRECEFTTITPGHEIDVAVVALTSDFRAILAKQYRPGPERVLRELPGGGVEDGSAEAAAHRELLEETGYATDDPLVHLGHFYREGYTNCSTEYFLATKCYKKQSQKLDETEFIDVELVSIDELIKYAKGGEMTDATAVLMAYDRLLGLKKEGDK